MIKIEITIKDEEIAQFGGIVIGNLIQDSDGKIVSLSDVSAPGFIMKSGAGKDSIYAKIVADEAGKNYYKKDEILEFIEKGLL